MIARVTYWPGEGGIRNFGDYLAELFLAELFLPVGLDGRVHLVGSVIDDWFLRDLGDGERAVFWGCGLRTPDGLSDRALPRCEILSVRGPLTRSALRLGASVPIGDPGFLLPALHAPSIAAGPRRTLCIPHYNDHRPDDELQRRSGCDDVLRTGIPASLAAVRHLIDRIASAEFVLTASLHGAVVAAAYGVPYAPWDNGHLDLPFKWADLAASLGVPDRFATDLAGGRELHASGLAPVSRIPSMWAAISVAPLAVRPEALLAIRALEAERGYAEPGPDALRRSASEYRHGQRCVGERSGRGAARASDGGHWVSAAMRALGEEAAVAVARAEAAEQQEREASARAKAAEQQEREASARAEEAERRERDASARAEEAERRERGVSARAEEARRCERDASSRADALQGLLSAAIAERTEMAVRAARAAEAAEEQVALIRAKWKTAEDRAELAASARDLAEERAACTVAARGAAEQRAEKAEAARRQAEAQLVAVGAEARQARDDRDTARREAEVANRTAELRTDAERQLLAARLAEAAATEALEQARRELGRSMGEMERLRGSRPMRAGRMLGSIARVPLRIVHALAVLVELGSWALRGRLVEGVRLRSYARLIRRSWLLDPEFYLAQCPSDASARQDPIRHYLLHGAAAGLDPNPYFDTSFYLERHPLAAGYGKNPIVHYVRYGARDRLPTSAAFDTGYYLDRNVIARESGLNPLSHFLVCGRKLGLVCAREPESPRLPPAGANASQVASTAQAASGVQAASAPSAAGCPAIECARPSRISDPDLLLAAPGLRLVSGCRTLIVDHRMLTPDQDSGSVRMLAIVKLLAELGHQITFVSDSEERMEAYEERMRPWAPRILYGREATIAHLLAEGGAYRHAILSRPDQAHRYLAPVRALAPAATLAYDTVDLHWVRMTRAAELTGDVTSRQEAERYRQLERINAEFADVTLVVTEQEQAVLAEEVPSTRVAVVPNVHASRPFTRGSKYRCGLLFIGGYEHRPNVDAVEWFVKEVLPEIRRELPEVVFDVVGSKPPDEVRALTSMHVRVHGHVPDVDPFFERSRVFVSPLRYGAGMKGKIGQAMTYGLPVVTTSIGAEGMKLTHEHTALIANDPCAFAEAVVRLHRDDFLWERLSERSRAHVDAHFSESAVRPILGELFPAKPGPQDAAAADEVAA